MRTNIISTYDHGSYKSSKNANVIIQKTQYQKIRKILGNSDPAWVRYADVFFNNYQDGIIEIKQMSRKGAYIFGYQIPGIDKYNEPCKILYLLQNDLAQKLHVNDRAGGLRKRKEIQSWPSLSKSSIQAFSYNEFNLSRYKRHCYDDKNPESLERSRNLNLKNNSAGKIRVVDFYPNFAYPAVPGYYNFAVTSRRYTKTRELSAFNMGPIVNQNAPDLFTLWLNCRIKDVNSGQNKWEVTDKDGVNRYHNDRDYGYRKEEQYYYWCGKKINEIEARKEIFCPIYADFAVRTESFIKLSGLIKNGYNVQLITSDVIPYSSDYDPDGQVLKDIFNDPSKPFTNAHVLAGLLTKNYVWV